MDKNRLERLESKIRNQAALAQPKVRIEGGDKDPNGKKKVKKNQVLPSATSSIGNDVSTVNLLKQKGESFVSDKSEMKKSGAIQFGIQDLKDNDQSSSQKDPRSPLENSSIKGPINPSPNISYADLNEMNDYLKVKGK